MIVGEALWSVVLVPIKEGLGLAVGVTASEVAMGEGVVVKHPEVE